MKKVAKIIAAILVILALAIALSYLALYGLYIVVIVSLFYRGLLFFVIGATLAGFITWIGLRVFERHKVYTLGKGVHHETTH
jgi:hypothetical protein